MNIYSYQEYLDLAQQSILTNLAQAEENPENHNPYFKLNAQRMKRWNRKNLVVPATKKIIESIQQEQVWTVISEPWCGDAAHILPVIDQIASLSDKIELRIVLRDENPAFMDEYLFNGTRSIPRLISRDLDGNDLFVWGPRPKHAQKIMNQVKLDHIDKTAGQMMLQKWYNEDKGQQTIREILHLMEKNEPSLAE